MQLRDAVIVAPVRTPVGKCGGVLAEVPAYKLGAAVIKETIARAGIDPLEIDDVIMGNLFSFDVANMARMCVLEAGLPLQVPGMTVDRQCSSALNAIMLAAALVMSGLGDVYIAGGAESDSRRPYVMERADKAYKVQTAPKFFGIQASPPQIGNPPMGITAENVADLYGITRSEMDEFALQSHKKALVAIERGAFDEQIVPITIPQRKGSPLIVNRDECPRPDISLEALSKLKPAFKEGGTVTAGNSSPMNDGASACVVMSREKAEEMGLDWMLKFKAYAIAALDPNYMGLGPIHSTRKLLKQTGTVIKDFDVLELNEAFAAQSIACIRDLGMDMEKVNVNGGAIALGHPLAATGGILTAKLAYLMRERQLKNGLISFCCGGGQGVTAWFEAR
ncbi:acetyl-CoA acetyltransferase [Desulfosporosinus acidiphilus SJ4]|uniref:Acetyl-CoA acetyltransferase n=1 Tax=Desulfosporosinus acidiphilus (strain DSM 22704 / JCM 16185 / SJ4) TaxID=646529 RepID=I4D775_DESAJ|nr:thiolase family protein [Desulfosporosinus acidiphilus]AFM41649.1 acetyl-CoA acetyltransferase [Desulfosporosinus acidiphilus SJ4]